MTYCHLDTEEIKRFTQDFSFDELRLWFEDLIGKYKKWAEFQIRWREKRNASVHGVEFPFPYRDGQRDLAVSVYRDNITAQEAVYSGADRCGEGLWLPCFRQ